MTAAEIILAAVTLQRVGELVVSRHNTQRLMARGAVEVAPGHYPLIVAVHMAWGAANEWSAIQAYNRMADLDWAEQRKSA